MPRPAPLRPGRAVRTLAHRFTRRADRLRQFLTRFGLRSTRVFLVWTKWTGAERGEGEEQELHRVELLPTPRVSTRTAISRMPFSAGTLPDGTLQIDQISCGTYTADNLTGYVIPGVEAIAPRASRGERIAGTVKAPKTDPRVDFFYELVEDDRGRGQSQRARFRVFGGPSRQEGSLYWTVTVQRTSDDLDRDGTPRVDNDDYFGEG